MHKKKGIVIVLAAAVFAAWVGPSGATLVSLPKALTKPFAGLDTAKPLWGPLTYDFGCIERLDECQGMVRKASLFSAPKMLKPQLDRLHLDTPVLGPMAHSVFCLQYPKDCAVRKIAFRGRKFELTAERRRELVEVNARVNRSIKPERNTLGLEGEKWIVAPKAGDCNDYAVTKQHELLARGWPSRTLLLAEVVTSWGEHHLILVVRTGDGDLVLDNLNANVRLWSKAPYQWVRVQSPRNPKWWSAVRSTNA